MSDLLTGASVALKCDKMSIPIFPSPKESVFSYGLLVETGDIRDYKEIGVLPRGFEYGRLWMDSTCSHHKLLVICEKKCFFIVLLTGKVWCYNNYW